MATSWYVWQIVLYIITRRARAAPLPASLPPTDEADATVPIAGGYFGMWLTTAIGESPELLGPTLGEAARSDSTRAAATSASVPVLLYHQPLSYSVSFLIRSLAS